MALFFRAVLDKVIELIESAKLRNITDENINSAIHVSFNHTDLVTAVSQASQYKCTYEENAAIIKNEADNFCNGENTQYKGLMEGFLKSTTTNALLKDISFLNCVMRILNSRLLVANDEITASYAKAIDVLNRLKPSS